MRNVLSFIFSFILAICIIGTCFLSIANRTVLNENYVINTLEKENYFSNCYWLIRANFENYIYQSGLDETVLENIISKEKVKEDIKIIISNLFKEQNKEIDTTDLKTNLHSNIEKYLEGTRINSSQKQAIDEFVDKIGEEYVSIISFYKIGLKGNYGIPKILTAIGFVKKALLILIGIDFLILLMLNLNRMYKFISFIGISSLTNGFITLFTAIFIRLRIKINTIIIINDFISQIIRDSIFDVLKKITICGIVSLVIGFILIIVADLIHNKKTNEKIKNRGE